MIGPRKLCILTTNRLYPPVSQRRVAGQAGRGWPGTFASRMSTPGRGEGATVAAKGRISRRMTFSAGDVASSQRVTIPQAREATNELGDEFAISGAVDLSAFPGQ